MFEDFVATTCSLCLQGVVVVMGVIVVMSSLILSFGFQCCFFFLIIFSLMVWVGDLFFLIYFVQSWNQSVLNDEWMIILLCHKKERTGILSYSQLNTITRETLQDDIVMIIVWGAILAGIIYLPGILMWHTSNYLFLKWEFMRIS